MFGRIVVGVGKTESARRAQAVAVDLAQRYGATLHVVMAFAKSGSSLNSGERKDAEAFVRAIATGSPVEVQTHAIPGDPADTILMVAEEVAADLIVVGNAGMRGARRLLGSVPNSVAHGASASVLIVDTISADA
jgi:nucleotide-binding universal stress UspA family protein